MKVAEYICKRLEFLGIDTCFLVTGGGAMHLNDAIGSSNFTKIYNHHEQASSIAAEAYARISKKPALLNVTTGPGGINALNGVFGAFTDSIPMVVVSGQVKRETMLSFNKIKSLRQLGDQEVNIINMVKGITKYSCLLKNADDIIKVLDKAFIEATTGRKGPVWIDLPVDLQGTHINTKLEKNINLKLEYNLKNFEFKKSFLDKFLSMLSKSKRPVILYGTGIRLSNSEKEFQKLLEKLKIPVVSAWTHDVLESEHNLNMGRAGTIGTRAGNFIVQNADLVIILGSRLNIRQVSYNWKSFARNAKKIWVDIDEAEFRKPFVNAELKIVSDLKIFLTELINKIEIENYKKVCINWINWCKNIKEKYTPKISDYPISKNAINAYHFIFELFEKLKENDIVAVGDATATIVPFQIAKIKKNQRLFSNSGSASMGYDLPASIGAAVAVQKNKYNRVICLAGDGSIMMNLQELQTIVGLNLNIIIFVLNNDGYLSIKQTQKNFFGKEYGSSSQSGLSFPNFSKLGSAFGYKTFELNKKNWKTNLEKSLNLKGPILCEVKLDTLQEFEPRLKSKMVDGKIQTPELEDMYPFLDNKEIQEVALSAKSCTE